MRKLSFSAMFVLLICVLSLYLPMLYTKIFIQEVENTHLFYSPVSKQFIYKEELTGPLPAESIAKAEDHHQGIAYRNQHGEWFNRVEFEKQLPFIYYKNMELWGLLPLNIDGKVLDKKTIQSNRMVLALHSGEISDRGPHTDLYPLFESNLNQVRLVFPEDRFRMTSEAMQFINADTNSEDSSLTGLFTSALIDKGFVFPARSVNGKFTVLKPYDEGAFLVDANYNVYHVQRNDDKPVVTKTPIPSDLKTRFIKVSENKSRKNLGLLLAGNGELFVLTNNNYSLFQLPLEKYNANTMDFKMISNPLFITAIYSDHETVRAIAMDKEYKPVDQFEHRMSRANVTTTKKLYDLLFPFSLQLTQDDGAYLHSGVRFGSWISFIGLMFCSMVLFVWRKMGRENRVPLGREVGLVALCGIFGLLALVIMRDD